MWQWVQSKGELLHNGEFISKGYSGYGLGKNNPELQSSQGIGPIPCGIWQITGVYNSAQTGPFTIALQPTQVTNTFGRSAFRIHGDSINNPGRASHGCIILPRPIRELIWNSNDKTLSVTE
jgi:hypothetical protein